MLSSVLSASQLILTNTKTTTTNETEKTYQRKRLHFTPIKQQQQQQLNEEISLDMCYLTPRIIIMGSPFVEDKLNSLKQYLETLTGRHKIFDFSCESDFIISQDLDNVLLLILLLLLLLLLLFLLVLLHYL